MVSSVLEFPYNDPHLGVMLDMFISLNYRMYGVLL